MINEFEFIEWLKKKIPRALQAEPGLGDDASFLKSPGGLRWVLTTDAIVEGVDFIFGKAPTEKVGRKALAIALSDLAAKGASPVAFLVTLGIPRHFPEAWVRRFYDGMLKLAGRYRVLCAGGDLSASKQFFASVTAIGKITGRPVLRSGARPGDWIGVTGVLGGSILRHHLEFEPRLREGKFLAGRFRPSAMMDISDGLLQDLDHLLKDSRAGAQIELSEIPISRDAKKRAKLNKTKAVERALTDGEDFELLFTCSPKKKRSLEKAWKKKFPNVRLSWIGRIHRSKKILWSWKGKPARAPRLRQKGYSHFAS